MTAVKTIAGPVLALAVPAATGVLLAIVIVRRSLLGFLPAVVFAVLVGFAGRPHIAPPAESALIHGIVPVVVAGAVRWCRRHPRSIDPRTENQGA